MCGIAGIYHLDGKLVETTTLQKMTDMLYHRGPDGEGFYEDGNLGFGHRRLKIIDLSDDAKQPMSNEEGTVWITYNGELYNYRELRDVLEKRGHQFKSQSDTEVIIHSYEEWDVNCLQKFNGMWAFSIWNKRKKQLFCARDRFGIKPFYYYFDGKTFIFASEIKAILVNNISINIDQNIIFDYLTHGKINNTDNTFFKNIFSLPPAHTLTIKNNNLNLQKYWELENREPEERDGDKIINDFKELFLDSVKMHLVSDVPVGSCLSGGLDSSSIVCAMSRLSQNPDRQKTFSACYDDEFPRNEKRYIDIVVKNAGTEAFFAYPDADILKKDIEKLIWHQEEPFLSSSIFAQWEVMKLAKRENVKVLLDGQGADELLAGYDGYLGGFFADLILSGNITRMAGELKCFSSTKRKSIVSLLGGALKSLRPSAVKEHKGYLIHKNKFMDKDFLMENMKLRRHANHAKKFKGILLQNLHASLTRDSLPELLRYEDKNSMAHSVEARVPYLDHQLAEFAFSLPNHYKLRNGYSKYILRESMKNIIPDTIRLRTDKIGFETPQNDWIRNSLKDLFWDTFHSAGFENRGYFDVAHVKKEFDAFICRKINSSKNLWRAFILEKWCNRFLDK